jgi:hypothetical protein
LIRDGHETLDVTLEGIAGLQRTEEIGSFADDQPEPGVTGHRNPTSDGHRIEAAKRGI